MHNKKISFVSFAVFIFFLLWFHGCSPLPERIPKTKDGKSYGNTEGLFRHRWWNYYERGLSFADGEFWEDAELDLREAIRQRFCDKRRTRTYGLHFIDYFPHRELGIVLFKQGKIEEAQRELELSYSDVKSAKAEFYLDRAREALLQKKSIAHHLPEIQMINPKQGSDTLFITNRFSVPIEGIAKDNAYVRHITVNRREVRVDVSAQVIPFRSEVLLDPGENKIPIAVTNLIGNSSELIVNIVVDNTGPIINLDEKNENRLLENSIRVTDDLGLAELSVNGQKYPLNGETEYRFPKDTSSIHSSDEYIVEAKDMAGNITIARINSNKILSKLVADNSVISMGQILLGVQGKDFPLILSHPLEEEGITYRDYAFFEGEISGNEIKELYIQNQKVVLTPGNKSYFSKKIPLQKGKNNIEIKGTTNSGFQISKLTEINRNSLIDKRPPLKLDITDFNRIPENIKEYLSSDFENTLMNVLKKEGRFVIGIPDKKEEKKDCILQGRIREAKQGIEVTVDLMDSETKESLIVDAYSEKIGTIISEELANKIKSKLIDEMPVKEGFVVKKGDNNQIAIDIGSESKMKTGMKIMIYDIKIEHDGKLRDLTSPVGQATIKVINEGASWATLDKDSNMGQINLYQPIVTR